MTVRRATIELLARTVSRVMTVRLAPIAFRVMTVGQLVTTDRPVTTVPLARIATTARSVPPATTVVMIVDQLVTIALLARTVSRVMTVPHVATRTSIRRVTKRPSTNPATTSCSIAFRRWQRLPMTSMV
jgi:hypothetical protein